MSIYAMALRRKLLKQNELGLLILLQILGDRIWSVECGPDFALDSKGRRIFSDGFRPKNYATVPIALAEPFVTAADAQFGALIEAAAVDKSGCVYATDFTGLRSSLGRISSATGLVDQLLFFNDTSASPSVFNGLRFLPTAPSSLSGGGGAVVLGRALAADEKGHGVVLLSQNGADQVTRTVFCHDPNMVQPNDIAIAPRAGRVYTSGQNYNSDTIKGDGDLWMCGAVPNFDLTPGALPLKPTRLGLFGRTNGIEVSPDENTLYLSEAFNRQGSVVSNKVWKFAIDSQSGYVWDQSLFVDFEQLDGTGSIDVDGMRTDAGGNLFVTRNGGGQVLKFSPQGQLLLRIELPGIQAPTNLELGGVDGTSLFVVGECAIGGPAGMGCVDVWHHNSEPGRAFRDLNSYNVD